jgi:chromosomal replication initiator protein
MGLDLPRWLIEFIASKITSNVRELEGALNRVVAHASLIGGALTPEVVQEVLRDLIRSNEKCITIEEIQKRTCDVFGVKLVDLLSSRRMKNLVRPRQIAMFLCKTLTTKSLIEIGRLFGGKDHATVIHATKRVIELCKEDAEMARSIEVLKALLTM